MTLFTGWHDKQVVVEFIHVLHPIEQLSHVLEVTLVIVIFSGHEIRHLLS